MDVALCHPSSCCLQAVVTAAELNHTSMGVLLLQGVGAVQPRGRQRARQGEAAGGLTFTVYPRKQGDCSNSGQKIAEGKKEAIARTQEGKARTKT